MYSKKKTLTPAILLKKLSTLKGTGISAVETVQWLQRFTAADKRRAEFEKTTGIPAPGAIIYSPTLRCNYSCTGCYSREHPNSNELSTERIDRLFTELEEIGTAICLISGGEPFMRLDLPDLMQKHPNLLFIVFTNGSKITEALAKQLQTSRNIIPVLSVEGDEATVSQRRGPKAWPNLLAAREHFKKAGLFFGFSTMVTRETLPQVLDPNFFAAQYETGAKIGFVMEYIPVGPDADRDLTLSPETRDELRQAVVTAQNELPFLLFQLPNDADDGTSCGAARRYLHLNASGGLEPCPFAHRSDSSIRDQSFKDALRSPLFEQIRNTPEVFHKKEINCALAENDSQLVALLAPKKPTPDSFIS